MGGFIKTIEISVLSIICSIVVGTVLALIKSYGPRPLRWLVSASDVAGSSPEGAARPATAGKEA